MDWEDAAILRKCRRCQQWLSLSEYKPNAHLCDNCVSKGHRPSLKGKGVHSITRSLTITPKGRMYLGVDSIPA